MTDARPLTPGERAIVLRILEHRQGEDAEVLRRQAASAEVVGGLPCFLDLAVVGERAARLGNGPLQGRNLVRDEQGQVCGEIIIWIDDGRLAGIEYAWVTDEMPEGLPPAEWVRVAE